ncbi:ADNP homeobox protein 2-like [Scleropages formosus]|uniref:ADNP homeobox protein 2-like n=1 Tax=Scleropages formosus TaxID=113540 RepID=A0A0P7XVV5_SCLFO|nr:ADNP homeobox protein 2-like [Scleropages formosus]
MYQVPVGNLDKIRKSRKKVKNILCDIGLENCKGLLEWRYRTQMLCCSLCKFSARTWHSYRNHIQRFHEEEQDLGSLSACSFCPFISHPKILGKHFRIFHSGPAKTTVFTGPSATAPLPSATSTAESYSCRKCAYQDSMMYCMKKHILVNHYFNLLNRYFGQRTESEQWANGPNSSRFYCKVCCLSAENSEHLLYHLLSSEKHKELEVHIKALIYKHKGAKKYLPNLAPKASQQPIYSTPVVPGSRDHQPAKTHVGPLPGGTLTGTILHGAPHNTTTLVCAPGTNPTFLPAQASALVQLASAEAKGLLRPASVVAAQQNTQPSRAFAAALPTTVGLAPPLAPSSVGTALPNISPSAPTPLPITVGVPAQPPSRQVLLPPGVQVNVQGNLGLRAAGPQPLLVTQRLPLSPPAPRGTMLASQSLLSHLIPTGNKVNGLPTYTLAPLHVTMPVQSSNVQTITKGPTQMVAGSPAGLPPQSKPTVADSTLNSTAGSKEAKKWMTCPVCNELFPSNVYQVHTEVAHKVSTKSSLQGLAARAPFLKKMPDKTVKCLMCKILLSEKGLFEHLLHGLNCLYCPGMFYSIKQLIEHTNAEHSPSQKANCDFMRREYRLYTDDHGNLLFPYFDINTTAPKELLGDKELNLALVTGSLDLIFLKMFPASIQPVCRTPVKTTCTDCPFCPEKLQSTENYHLHLKVKHYIMPTIHAILKTPAFKCIYCSGVYSGKTTPKAISMHVQRCRCAPKTAKDVERLINPDLRNRTAVTGNKGDQGAALYPKESASKSSATDAELQSKLRLEVAVREAVEANKREREARAAKRRRVESPKNAAQPVVQNEEQQEDSEVALILDPTGMEMRSFEERKEFLTKFFNRQPYVTKKEAEILAARLWLNKSDVNHQFGMKRTKCMKAIQKKRTVVLLGFNMAELKKVKHNLLIPEIHPEEMTA